jgi:hypothetical protein
MTVETTTNRVSYTGNGVTTVFAFPYEVYAADQIAVSLVDITTGVETVLTLNTSFTVTVTPDFSSASITLSTPAASTKTILIRRVLALKQTFEYPANNKFPSRSHEQNLDYAAMRDQDLQDQVSHAIQLPISENSPVAKLPTKNLRTNKVLAFDDAGAMYLKDISSFGTGDGGGEGDPFDIQAATVEGSRSNASLPLINLLTPKFNPANYASFIGDGGSSDQTAIDAMMADIASIAANRLFICIEMPSDKPVRGQIKKLCTGGADAWRNVYIEGNGSVLLGNTKPATLSGSSPLAGDGILHFQGVDGLSVENLKVDGLCYNRITGLSQASGTATCTTAETHNLVTGEYIAIMDVLTDSVSDPQQRMRDETYNGGKFITVTGANTFTYSVHASASATPIISNAKCTFKTTQFGGDNIRLVSCTRVTLNGIDTRHSNDHGIYFVSTTNSANTTDAGFALTDNNVLVSNLYSENCTQTSSTPSGVREMIWNNILCRFFRGGAVKFAAHLINGEVYISGLQCYDFSNVGNATTPNGFILEGAQRVYLDGFNFARAGGAILLPNPTSSRPGQKILKDVIVQNGVITDCGYCYAQTKARENHGVIIGDNSVTTGSDAVSNVTVRNVDVIRPYGKGYQLGNNNAGTLNKVQIIGGNVRDPALQAIDASARNMANLKISGVNVSKTSETGLVSNWVTGTSYTRLDVVYVAASGSYFRKTNAGTATSTIEPPEFNGNVLSDGCQWKNLGANSVMLVGPREGQANDWCDDAFIQGNTVEVWVGGSGIDITKARRPVIEGNILSNVGRFGINVASTQKAIVRGNTVPIAGINPFNAGNNLDIAVQNNYFDCNFQNRNAANFNNDDGILYTGNTHANSQSSLSPLGTTLNNIRRLRAYNNVSIGCTRLDRLQVQIAARRRNIDGSFVEFTHDTGLTNGDAVMLTKGATIKNAAPAAGVSSQVYVTGGGFNTRFDMSTNLSTTGISGAYFNPTVFTSGAFSGAAAAWNWTGGQPVYFSVGNNGAGTPTSGASAIPADYMGIPDGSTINSCGHWTWISWNDFGYPLMVNGESVSYETGKVADGYPNARASGAAITAMSYDSGTGVVTCTATGHGLTNGEFYTIARAYPTNYSVNADSNTDGTKDANPVTVIDANTFTYTVATGLTLQPAMGIVLIKQSGAIQGNVTITRSGTVATMTATGHGVTTGQPISVRAATDDLYNVTGVTCTVLDANTLTYNMTGTPAASPAVSETRLAVFGMYWSEAHNTRTVGAGGFVTPKTRGIAWGDFFMEFYGIRAKAERIGVVPYRTTVTVNPGTVNAGATANSADLTLTGINAKMIGRCTSINTSSAGLEARVVIVGANTYRIVWYNPTAGNLTPGALIYDVEVFNTLPWNGTEGVS